MSENFPYDEEKSIEQAIAKILLDQHKQLSVAESCTGGLLAHRLTNISGSSGYFKAGVVSYSNVAKINFLGVSDDTLKHFGAVSSCCARQMAWGIRKTTGSDIGLSTTGIAGPTGDTPWKPVGLVYIGYADDSVTISQSFFFSGKREENKQLSTDAALNLLWQKLIYR